LWVEELSSTTWTSRPSGTERSIKLRNLRNSSDVVVGLALGHTRHQRQDRCRALQRLDLGLLIDTEDDRRFGRVEVEPDDVSDLVDELRVGRELEVL
jgi:hypothetical protein